MFAPNRGRAAALLNSRIRRHTMRYRHRAIISILVFIVLLAALPGIIYFVGLAKVHDRPTAADPALFSQEAITTAWAQCHEELPITVEPTNPWSVTSNFFLGSPQRTAAGARSAWRIASTHNALNPVGNNLWWHTSSLALTIWVTRHWSAEQIGATLIRDGLCK